MMSMFLKSVTDQLSRVLMRLAPLFPDRLYLRLLYFLTMGRILHLNYPSLFSEKIQWLKLHQKDPKFTQLVDKLAVKDHITHLLGSEYICPIIAIWDSVNDIDLSTLPAQFVLKTTHSGGNEGVVICQDKSQFDLSAAKEKLSKSMRYSIYDRYREWPYKNVRRRIFAEKYLGDNITDYKFYCCNGQAICVLICVGRQSGNLKYYFFNKSWELCPYNQDSIEASGKIEIAAPHNIRQMFELSERLSTNFPFVRIDLFDVDGKIYFGEYTFYPASGIDPQKTMAFDQMMGNCIDLSAV